MIRRTFSIGLILLLLTTTIIPFTYNCSSYFVYSEEQELTVEETIDLALGVYLNSRGGYITTTNESGLDYVESVMKSWMDVYFGISHNITSAAELAALCVVKYSPFRISLKGSAVRFFNDLYDWLKDNDKFPNVESNNGGDTVDNVYNGVSYAGNLFAVLNTNNVNALQSMPGGYPTVVSVISPSDFSSGTYVDGFFGNTILNVYEIGTGWNLNSNDWGSLYGYTVHFSSDVSANVNLRGYMGSGNHSGYASAFGIDTTWLSGYNDLMPVYGGGYIGGAYWYVNRLDPTWYYYGYISYNLNNGKYYIYKINQIRKSNLANVNSVNVNFETKDFSKSNPAVPDEGEEEEYIPKDSETGDTFNTYNEYMNRYIVKKTIIRKEVAPDPVVPGGEVPDWSDSGSGSGTIVPDGNGGYTFNLPDFNLPDLDINWSIEGLGEKFPFSIPFDLIAFFTVLNAEAEVPEIQGTIDLGLVQWDIDWDLEEFNSLASLLRNLEFIGFCIALALITRRLIKG